MKRQSPNRRCPGGPIIDDKNIKKENKSNQKKIRKIKKFFGKDFVMKKTSILTNLVALFIYQTALTYLPKISENRNLIDNCQARSKDIFAQIPNARFFKLPENYYNFLISAGIGKKTAVWFLNKTNQKQLIIAFKETKDNSKNKRFSNWHKTFYLPFLKKCNKIYKDSDLSDKFCCQNNIY